MSLLIVISSSWIGLQGNHQLLILIPAAVTLLGAGAAIIARVRRDPRERERRRRQLVNRYGRMGEATITDFFEDCFHYTYSVSGVAYVASQNVAALRDLLPGDPERLVGHATMKYLPRNPANSILVCEQWSGVRRVDQSLQKGA